MRVLYIVKTYSIYINDTLTQKHVHLCRLLNYGMNKAKYIFKEREI